MLLCCYIYYILTIFIYLVMFYISINQLESKIMTTPTEKLLGSLRKRFFELKITRVEFTADTKIAPVTLSKLLNYDNKLTIISLEQINERMEILENEKQNSTDKILADN